MKDDRLVLCLEKLEGADQQGNVVTVDRSEIAKTKVLEEDARQEDLFHSGLDLVREMTGALAANPFDELSGLIMQVSVGRTGGDAVEIGRNSSGVLGDRPLIIVEDNDQALGGLGDIVESFVADAAGEGCVPGDRDHVFLAAVHIACRRHAKCCGEGRTGMSGPVAVVGAFGAEQESVESAMLPHGVHLLAPSRQDLVDVTLMADVEEELVGGGLEDPMKRNREFDHPQVRSKMAAGLGQRPDQLLANLLRKAGEILFGEFLEIGGRVDPVKQTRGTHDS